MGCRTTNPDIVQPMRSLPSHWGPIGALLAMCPARCFAALGMHNVLARTWAACVFSIKLLTGDVRQLLGDHAAVWVFLAVATLNVAVRQSTLSRPAHDRATPRSSERSGRGITKNRMAESSFGISRLLNHSSDYSPFSTFS